MTKQSDMLDYPEFMRRVNHNYRLARQVLAGNMTALEAVHRALTWQTSRPGEVSSHIVVDSFHDIVCGLFTGQLANLARSGHDAYDMDPDGEVVLLEHKTCDVDRSKIWRNQNGALCHGAAVPGRIPSGLTSQIRAAYQLGDAAHRDTKRIRTNLLLFDVCGPGNREAPFAAWSISGDWLVENRLKRDGHAVVTVGTFRQHGEEISANPRAPLLGWDAWVDGLRNDPTLPVVLMRAGRVVGVDGGEDSC